MPETDIDPIELESLPSEVFDEVARFLPATDLFNLMTTSKQIAADLTTYIDRMTTGGYIVNSGTGLAIERTTPRREVTSGLIDGSLMRTPGDDPTSSVIDVLKGKDSNDATTSARVIARRSGSLEIEAPTSRYALDAVERIRYAFDWLAANDRLLTARNKSFTRQDGESTLDMARRWEDVSGVLAPFN